jgi:hypothetical protein
LQSIKGRYAETKPRTSDYKSIHRANSNTGEHPGQNGNRNLLEKFELQTRPQSDQFVGRQIDSRNDGTRVLNARVDTAKLAPIDYRLSTGAQDVASWMTT